MGHLSVTQPPKHQADAVLSQASPTTATWYTVLDTTANVRILSIEIDDVWATAQPTPLELQVTIDGVIWIFTIANPATAQAYEPRLIKNVAAANQDLTTQTNIPILACNAFLEGRSVKVEARITWAGTTGQTLNCRVKYAKY